MGKRLVPLSGIVFAALAVVTIVVHGGNTPGISATPSEVSAFYTSHHDRQSTASFLLALSVLFLAVFAAALWRELTDDREEALARLGGALTLLGAGVATAGYLVAAAVHLALAESVHHGIGPAGAQALNAIDAEDFQPFSIGTAIMLLGAAALTVRRTDHWKWLGWIAALLGIAVFTPVGFFAYLGANVWIVVASIALASTSHMRPSVGPSRQGTT